MRRLLACLAIALAVPASAAATSMPPLHGPPPLVKFVPNAPQRNTTSCSAHERSAKTRATRFANKLAPVACEQPPRPKLVNSLAGAFFGR
jgi:hypothetical protein